MLPAFISIDEYLRLIYYIDSSSNVHEKILNFTHDSDTFQKMVKPCFLLSFLCGLPAQFSLCFLAFFVPLLFVPLRAKSTSRPGLHSGRDVLIEDSIAVVASAFLGIGEAVKPHFGSFYIVCTLPVVCARLRLHIPSNLRLSLQHRVNHGRQNADGGKGHADVGAFRPAQSIPSVLPTAAAVPWPPMKPEASSTPKPSLIEGISAFTTASATRSQNICAF